MTHSSVDRIVNAYLAYYEAIKTSPQALEKFEAWEEVEKLVRNEPDQAWEVIQALVVAARDDGALGYVAAGPLEDFLCWHGVDFIARVEHLAASDEKFHRALSGVWGWNRMNPAIRARVDAAVGNIEGL